MRQTPTLSKETQVTTNKPSPSEIVQEPTLLGSQVAVITDDSKDIEMPDAEDANTLDAGSSPSNPPVQKPRPPDNIHTDSNSSTVTEVIPPPPPWPSHTTQPSATHPRPINGYHASDLRVMLPPSPQLPNEPISDSPVAVASSPVSIFSPSIQSLGSCPPALMGNTSTLVQPSPVKKISVADWWHRKYGNNKAESPSSPEKNATGSSASSLPQSKTENPDGEEKPVSAESGKAGFFG